VHGVRAPFGVLSGARLGTLRRARGPPTLGVDPKPTVPARHRWAATTATATVPASPRPKGGGRRAPRVVGDCRFVGGQPWMNPCPHGCGHPSHRVGWVHIQHGTQQSVCPRSRRDDAGQLAGERRARHCVPVTGHATQGGDGHDKRARRLRLLVNDDEPCPPASRSHAWFNAAASSASALGCTQSHKRRADGVSCGHAEPCNCPRATTLDKITNDAPLPLRVRTSAAGACHRNCTSAAMRLHG